MHTAIDVGGTFTDVAVWDGRALRTGKVPSTPDPSVGVLAGMSEVAGPTPGALLHGTTVATNTILERSGARTVLITDEGFEDLIEIGRQDRPSLYDTTQQRPAPLVARVGRVGVPGRTDPGAVAGDVDDSWIEKLVAAQPESVAVSLLYSFLDGGRERVVRDMLRSRLGDVPISISSEVVAEFREYERASTTVLNAYLVPRTSSYLRSLLARSLDAGVTGDPAVMRSSGGLVGLEEAARIPASIVLSGPAGGVVAASAVGSALGHNRVISFDMGGTSTDVCRIDDGRPEVNYERAIDGLPCRMPSVAIHTVGAGGGSVGWVDSGGALRVGPRSSGAVPGPASYGNGGLEPAVTDANLIAGRIGSSAQLAGGLELDAAAAMAAASGVGERVGMSEREVALGMIEVVESHMHRAIRAVSVEEGSDPRDAVLVAFGGAGGLHATALARKLEMAGVLIPLHAGVFSAFGLLLAPPRADVARSVVLETGDSGGLESAIAAVVAAAQSSLGMEASSVDVVVDVRYRGQSHETSVPYVSGSGWEALADTFHLAHHRRNGFSRPGDDIEAVTVRCEAVGEPALTWDHVQAPGPVGDPQQGERTVLTGDGEASATVWWRPALETGLEITGPAVIEEPEATTFLDRGERAIVHDSGALVIDW